MPDINLADAARFLKLLDPTATKFEFRTFDDNKSRKDKNLTRTFYGTLAEHAAELKRLNKKGAGVFVVINETDGIGRETENIIRVRAVYIDLDGSPLEPVMAARRFKPHIAVKSSPGKWHCYWLVEDMALDDFELVQRALIEHFNSDPKVIALTGVMRLPGFYHCKAKPFLVSIASALDTPAYHARHFKQAKRPKRRIDDDIEINIEKVIAALDAATNNNVDEDKYFRLMASAHSGSDGHEDAYQAFVRFSKQSIKHNDKRTRERWRAFNRKPPRNIGPGTLYAHANETALGWREAMLAEALATLASEYAALVREHAAAAKAKTGGRDA
jgi:hypothetical protein